VVEEKPDEPMICYFCKKPLDNHTKEDVKACFETFLNGKTKMKK